MPCKWVVPMSCTDGYLDGKRSCIRSGEPACFADLEFIDAVKGGRMSMNWGDLFGGWTHGRGE